MKLARWSLHFYRLPYTREVVWSNAVERSGLFALLRLESGGGAVGIAEGTIKNTWSGVSPRSLQAALEDVVIPALKDVDLSDPDRVAGAYAKIPENRLAKGLVDNACWTMRAAAARRPPPSTSRPAKACPRARWHRARRGRRQDLENDVPAASDEASFLRDGHRRFFTVAGHKPRTDASPAKERHGLRNTQLHRVCETGGAQEHVDGHRPLLLSEVGAALDPVDVFTLQRFLQLRLSPDHAGAHADMRALRRWPAAGVICEGVSRAVKAGGPAATARSTTRWWPTGWPGWRPS